jgi:hypothetical protein
MADVILVTARAPEGACYLLLQYHLSPRLNGPLLILLLHH